MWSEYKVWLDSAREQIEQFEQNFETTFENHTKSAQTTLPITIEQYDAPLLTVTGKDGAPEVVGRRRFGISADLPGYNVKDITVKDSVVYIVAERRREEDPPFRGKVLLDERRYEEVTRSVDLGIELDPSTAHAVFQNGVLSVTIAELPASKKDAPVKIKVNTI